MNIYPLEDDTTNKGLVEEKERTRYDDIVFVFHLALHGRETVVRFHIHVGVTCR